MFLRLFEQHKIKETLIETLNYKQFSVSGYLDLVKLFGILNNEPFRTAPHVYNTFNHFSKFI